MAKKKVLKRFLGVYFSESRHRFWRERPDRCYWVNFKDAHGKLHWERCGWASEGWTPEAAQKRRYEILEKDRVGTYKTKAARRAERLTLGEFMEKHYLPWAAANKRRCRDDLSIWKTWLAPRFAGTPLGEIASLDLERLKREMREAGRAEATVKHALCLVRQAFNRAALWRLHRGPNPCQGVKFPRINNGRLRFLTREEAALLLAALAERSPRVARMAALSLYGGLRLGEVSALRWGDVDLQQGLIILRDTKNRTSRPVFITAPIREVLQEIGPGEPEDLVFRTQTGGPVRGSGHAFARVVAALGLNAGLTDPRMKVTFHTLRHTYASWAVMAGVPLYVVGKALGHKTLTMTARYSHLAPDSHRQAAEAVARAGMGGAAPGLARGPRIAIPAE